jgi:phospholipid/cholesterol/gamma-HCH transport system substrate-binding protein
LRGLPAEGVAEKKNGQSPFFFGARGRLPPLKDFDFEFDFDFYFDFKVFIMGITASQKTRLGIFVIIGMLVLSAFIVVPLVEKMSYRTKTYYTYFENESLQGLEQGASVKFNGVSIGKVQKVSYYPEDITKMKVEMSIADNFPMRVDMTVGTGLIGITGLKYVEISGGSNEAEILKPGGVIPTRVTMFSTIANKAEALTEMVEVLLSHLNILTHPDSLRSVAVTIDNIAALTGDARDAFRDMRELIPKAGTMADTVQRAMDEALKAVQDIKATTATLKDAIAANDLQRTIARVDSTIVSVKGLTDNVSLMVLQTREDISISMENLREAMESANQLMRLLADDPSLLIRGERRGRDTR